jgi:hypothetical protein
MDDEAIKILMLWAPGLSLQGKHHNAAEADGKMR